LLQGYDQAGRILDAVAVAPTEPVAATVPFKAASAAPVVRPGPSIANSMESAMAIATRLPERVVLKRRERPDPPPKSRQVDDDIEVVEDDRDEDDSREIDDVPDRRRKPKRRWAPRRGKSMQWVPIILSLGMIGGLGMLGVYLFDRRNSTPNLVGVPGGQPEFQPGFPPPFPQPNQPPNIAQIGRGGPFIPFQNNQWESSVFVQGDWSSRNGLIESPAGGRAGWLQSKGIDTRNFQLTCEYKYTGEQVDIAYRTIPIRAVFEPGYSVSLAPNLTFTDGQSRQTQRLNPGGVNFTPGEWYTWDLLVSGNTHSIKVNGVEVLNYVDRNPPVGHGFVLFKANSAGGRNVRAVEIRRLDLRRLQ
jgi:Domain of Unknown Function (DUF1080)